ncbi:hypothetical protein BKA65DRAFT_573865 [Rhexocercosporidium sp. MPI-PUGE-AT-0058]|nr:hypothetical protein BKA65DRAFT_573865 [Rhexocercosporidium sp. MPI-PUGE-AT-0058]
MNIGSAISNFFTSPQATSHQIPSPTSTSPRPQVQLVYRPAPKPVANMLLLKNDIPYRLFRAGLETKSCPSPGTVGFIAPTVSFPFPKTTAALYEAVLNHDDIVTFRIKGEREVLGLKKPGGPGDEWVEGLGKPWRLWAVTRSKLKGVLRVKGVLGFSEVCEIAVSEEQFLVWKHIGSEAVYAAEYGSYDCIRKARVEEIQEMGMQKKDSEAEADAERQVSSLDDDEEEDADREEGGASLIEDEDVHGEGHRHAAARSVARGRSKTFGTSGMAASEESRSWGSGKHA